MILYKSNWNILSADEIKHVVIKGFNLNNTHMPDDLMCERLSYLGNATVELLEIRNSSVTYRIRQTGDVFLIYSDGKSEHFDFNSFQSHKSSDVLISSYKHKDLVFIGYIIQPGLIEISYLKNPKFKLLFNNSQLKDTIWIDQKPDQDISSKLISKGLSFYKSYFSI